MFQSSRTKMCVRSFRHELMYLPSVQAKPTAEINELEKQAEERRSQRTALAGVTGMFRCPPSPPWNCEAFHSNGFRCYKYCLNLCNTSHAFPLIMFSLTSPTPCLKSSAIPATTDSAGVLTSAKSVIVVSLLNFHCRRPAA